MTTLILTTMNEIDGIKHIWPRIPFQLFKNIIIVDNNSTDGTLQYIVESNEIRQYPIRIIQQTKPGRGNAYCDAMQLVDDNSVMLMCSDGNDDPAFIPILLSKFADGYDIVQASRFLLPLPDAVDNSDDPYHVRRIGRSLLTFLVNYTFGSKYTDTNFGFRVVTTLAWKKMNMHPQKNETEYLMSIRAARLKLDVAEVPIIEGKRQGGVVKAKTWSTGLNHLGVWLSEVKNQITGVIMHCQFHSVCPLYDLTSFICTHHGGTYCGQYRKFMESKRSEC